MAIAVGARVKPMTGGRTLIVTGQVGSVVSWITGDGALTGSFEESLVKSIRTDGDPIITGRNKVGLY
jgi:hypothetical protein